MYTRHGHHIKGTVLEDRPIGLLTARCGGPTICKDCAIDAQWALSHTERPAMEDLVGTSVAAEPLNDQNAVTAVFDALKRAGLSGPQIVAVLNDMDNQGVIFRMEKD